MSETNTAAAAGNTQIGNRWVIAIMGTLLQVCLGTVYAWSYFQKPIMSTYGWNNSQVAWIFSLAICFLGIAAAWGGINLPKFGPTKLAATGGALYGLGYILSMVAMKMHSLPMFYAAYGIIGGIGLGLGYVTPVATAAKWFPDKKGFITGMVVMGFGLGALVMSKVFAPNLMKACDGNLPQVFLYIGIIMMVLAATAGLFMRNPPQGYIPAGWTPPSATAEQQAAKDSMTAKDCICSNRFLLIWLFFFANITAGIMFIGFQSPMIQSLVKATGKYADLDPEAAKTALAGIGATLIAVSSLFNGVGRFFWGGLSDKVGRVKTFRLILGSQILVFIALLFVKSPLIFGILVCYVLLCYGGGFGTAPSTVLTIFGSRLMPVVYGTLLTAWSAAGIAGPQIAAVIKDNFAEKASLYTFSAGAVILTTGLLLTFFVSDERFKKKA
ncbi:MAG: OFA family MFS transporter [Pontiellaceae bacterium]|jgi:OFA family oxalate/formate antiporter-like MFS transporter|nr:OFA family MFS transporter [Pontiellaceae bacterium]